MRYGRRLDAAVAAEVERLAEMAITDPLTGLRNHRAFHEDVARELQRAGRTGVPLALVLLDLDDLKAVNDTQGHQAGDERLQALADAIRATGRGADVAYRVGGDEFAVILPDARSVGRAGVRPAPARRDAGRRPRRRALHRDRRHLRGARRCAPRTSSIREADLALIGAKRIHQDVVIYGPDLAPGADRDAEEDEHHTRTLASALARAVDAKDSYTRSHCQTVSQLCGLIGAELGFDAGRLTRLRLAGLLHDVGKIGVPDAILNKPAKLTDDEYEHMKRHSLLGYDIVQAADMEVEARWVRHHHERFDGGGYPDGLAGEEIPLESRVILVADAFEAMTSDRPYRQAPGPVLRDRRARPPTPARSSIRPSSRPSPACSPAPARSGTCPLRATAGGLTVSAAARRAVAGVGGRDDARRGADRAQLLELLAQRGLPLVVEGAARRAVLIEVAEDEVGNVGFAHWYGLYTQRASSEP